MFVAAWDDPDEPPFPALRRFAAGSPAVLAGVSKVLGAHPFASLVEGQPDRARAPWAGSPVALDPGDDLTGWAELRMVDGAEPVEPATTGWNAPGRTVLLPLRDFARRWCDPLPPEDDGEIEVHPALIRRVGRGGVLVDAQLADPGAEVEDYEVVYDEGDPPAFVSEQARRLRARRFARRTGLAPSVAKRARKGKISPRNVAIALGALLGEPDEGTCALDGCDRPLPRPNARYCSRGHADRAYRLRRRAAQVPEHDACPNCGTVLLGAAAQRCPICNEVVAP